MYGLSAKKVAVLEKLPLVEVRLYKIILHNINITIDSLGGEERDDTLVSNASWSKKPNGHNWNRLEMDS